LYTRYTRGFPVLLHSGRREHDTDTLEWNSNIRDISQAPSNDEMKSIITYACYCVEPLRRVCSTCWSHQSIISLLTPIRFTLPDSKVSSVLVNLRICALWFVRQMLRSFCESPLVPDIQWHYGRVRQALALGRNGVDVEESWVAHPVRNSLFIIATQSSMLDIQLVSSSHFSFLYGNRSYIRGTIELLQSKHSPAI
jgi:hypothetical protein